RPPPAHPLHYHRLPHPLLTLFPPQHKQPTQQPTHYFQPYPPSTPSFPFIKHPNITHIIQPHQIQPHHLINLINQLQNFFHQYSQQT
ncbi:BrxA/BrxB family bacilliredoxin, partial [Staphylococcus warneri]|uniref:BrxA/BrxB family bacilliredoxin n=1 Tax=Staphylococcus warneri TaxID=1292 RepID=UPI001642C706